MSRAEALTKAGLREIEVSITLMVPVTAPQAVEGRLIGALSTYAADLMWVREAGIRKASLPYDDLLFLWNEVQQAGPIVRGIDTGGIFERLTCTEAEALAGVFAAAGRQDVHDFIIEQHGLGDDDPDDTHYETFRKVMYQAGAEEEPNE